MVLYKYNSCYHPLPRCVSLLICHCPSSVQNCYFQIVFSPNNPAIQIILPFSMSGYWNSSFCLMWSPPSGEPPELPAAPLGVSFWSSFWAKQTLFSPWSGRWWLTSARGRATLRAAWKKTCRRVDVWDTRISNKHLMTILLQQLLGTSGFLVNGSFWVYLTFSLLWKQPKLSYHSADCSQFLG